MRPAALRPLILGAAHGYEWPQVEVFVRTWQRYVPGSDLVLLVARTLSAESRRRLREAGVRLRFPPQPAFAHERHLRRIFVRSGHAVRARRALRRLLLGLRSFTPTHLVAWRGFAAQTFHIATWRFFFYLHEALRRPSGPILLSDVRDVLFQADPFPSVPARGVVVALETAGATLATERYNSAWLDHALGREVWGAIGANRISCVGTTLGRRGAVIGYLTRICGEMMNRAERCGAAFGPDQALHNWLLWTGRLSPVGTSRNGEGPLASLSGEDPAVFGRDGAGRLLNADGRPVPVVHQYDRWPELAAALPRALLSGTG